ncbi:hypothetical protein ASZ78_000728 [Callipepla squamata]|uniref:Uncharacterized protein n=1 Tax=Callipepla squamata TaxID=9009 RepID=A0A226N291_CALSU|nr:hypothetical protein ASZ78_000728 [Callipepla squamata]
MEMPSEGIPNSRNITEVINDDSYLAPRNLPSAGFFPFLQTVLCDSDARCKGTPYTPEDLLPRLNDISSLKLCLHFFFLLSPSKQRSSSRVSKDNHPSPRSAEVPESRNASLAFRDSVSHGENTLWNISPPSNLSSSINVLNKILSFGKSKTRHSVGANLKVILCEILSRYIPAPALTEEKMAANIHRTFCSTDSSLLKSFTQEFRRQLSQVQHNPQYQAVFVNEMVSFLTLVSQVQNDTSLWHLFLLAPDVFQGSMQLQDVFDFLQNASSVVLAAQNVSASLVTDDRFKTVRNGVTDPPHFLNCLEQDKEKSLVIRYICNRFNWKDKWTLVSQLEEVLRNLPDQLLALQKIFFIMTNENIGYEYLLFPVLQLMRKVESSMGESRWHEFNSYWRLGEKLRSMEWSNSGIVAYGQLLEEFGESSIQHSASLKAKIWEFLHVALSPFLENRDSSSRTIQNCSAQDVLHVTLQMLFENVTLRESLSISPCKDLFASMDVEGGTMPNETFTKLFQLAIRNLKLSPEFAAVYKNSSERFSKELSCTIQSLQLSLRFLSKLKLVSEVENPWVEEKARALTALLETLLQSNASCPIPVQDMGGVIFPFVLNETELSSLNVSDSSVGWNNLTMLFSMALSELRVDDVLQRFRDSYSLTKLSSFSSMWDVVDSSPNSERSLAEVAAFAVLLEAVGNDLTNNMSALDIIEAGQYVLKLLNISDLLNEFSASSSSASLSNKTVLDAVFDIVAHRFTDMAETLFNKTLPWTQSDQTLSPTTLITR